MRRILLVEPGYRSKFPPLGLMKIATYHKVRGDYVEFVKGRDPNLRSSQWDRVYVTSLFTYYWKETVRTINYYKQAVNDDSAVIVGGVLASLMPDELRRETGVTIVQGLLDQPGVLDTDSKLVIDELTPDYEIVRRSSHAYSLLDSYLGYATRGCPNRCGFCAVHRIEPRFVGYLPIKRQVQGIERVDGEKRNLVLLDNNVRICLAGGIRNSLSMLVVATMSLRGRS